MTLRSAIKRIFSGPTVHKLVCYIVTENILNCNCNPLYSEDIIIEELNPKTCDRVLAIRGDNVKCIFERMTGDSLVILAKWHGEIVGHAVLKPHGKKGNCDLFWKNKDYIHYCYVAPQYRGKGIFPHMLFYLAQKVFSEQGGRIVYISTDCKNQSSICGIQKAGFCYWRNLMEYGWGGIILFHRLKQVKEKDKMVWIRN